MSNSPGNTTVVIQQAPTNGIGLAGFIISLIGFLTCGCLSPLGLFLSFVGLLRPPRGFGLAGVILGLIGSWWLWAFGMAMIAGFVGLGAAATQQANEAVRQAEQQRAAESLVSPQPGIEPVAPSVATPDPPPLPEQPTPDAPSTAVPADSSKESDPVPEPTPDPVPMPAPEPSVSEYREFKSAGGSFTVMARFITLADGKVTLRRKDNDKVITVDLEKLSQDDRDWIADRMKSSGK